MSDWSARNARLRQHFEKVTLQNSHKSQASKPSASPFSLRLTAEERAWLDEQAGFRPLGDYIRSQILGDNAEKRRTLRKPTQDSKQIGLVLATLGDSRLASNLNQLAKHANMGTLDVSEEVETELLEACAAVIAMRDTLFRALGHRPRKDSEE